MAGHGLGVRILVVEREGTKDGKLKGPRSHAHEDKKSAETSFCGDSHRVLNSTLCSSYFPRTEAPYIPRAESSADLACIAPILTI